MSRSIKIKLPVGNFNLTNTYAKFRYFPSRLSQMTRSVLARESYSFSRMQVRTYVSALSELNLLLGAVAKTKVDSYGAYFVTEVSPFLLSLFFSSSLIHSLCFLITLLHTKFSYMFSGVIYVTLLTCRVIYDITRTYFIIDTNLICNI